MLLEAGAKSDLRIGSDQIFGAVLAEGVDVRGGSHRGRGGRGARRGGRSGGQSDDVNVNFAQELASATSLT